MMKKIKIVFAALLTSLLFCACGNSIPDMSTEQEQLVGEYAAITLLKFDAKYRSRIVEMSYEELNALDEAERLAKEAKEKKEKEKAEAAAAKEEKETAQNDATSVIDKVDPPSYSPEEILEFPNGLTFSVDGYEITKGYPSTDDMSSFFSLSAEKGKDLCVVHITLTNGSGSDAHVDFLNGNYRFKLISNGSYARTALTTMLDDDLSTLNVNLGSGNSAEYVLIFEVEENSIGGDSLISLQIKNESNVCTISI